MRLAIALIITALPLAAQQVLPEADAPAAIAPVIPVPLPTDSDLLIAQDIAPATPKSVSMRMEGGADYLRETKTVTSRGAISAVSDTGMTLRADRGRFEGESRKLFVDGQVKLKTETGIEIFADHGVLDDKTHIVTLTGNVSIYQGQTLQRGDKVVYLMDQKKIDASGLRTSVDPILLEAGQFTIEERDGKQVYVGHDAGVTTHDVEDPGFWLRASETTVYPGDRVSFRNLKLYAGDVPIFWLPYFSQPLDGELGYHFTPGARSSWGGYLLNSYGVMLGGGDSILGEDAWLLSRWNFDIRSRRGLGAGLDLIDRRQSDNPNLTGLSLYYSNDLDPNISRTGLPRAFVNEDRWRAALQYRIPLSLEGGDKWWFDYNLNALSDRYYLEDFDPSLFRTDPNPDNTLGLFRRDERSLFGLVARVRPNQFYRSDTRLPEISYDQARRPIFDSPILHEGNTSLAFVREHIGNPTSNIVSTLLALPPGSPGTAVLLSRLPTYERSLVLAIRALPPGSPAIPSLVNQLYGPGYNRFNTYQEFSMPTHIGGWLHFTPEVGAGYSRYWDSTGPATNLSRFHFYLGAEASLKFTKDFGDYTNRKWGLDGLLHVFQPYGRFSFINTDDLNPLYPAVDRETISTRPRTLSPNRFTAIDDLRDWSIFRLGMRNRLITKRDGQSYEWLYLDTYFDTFIDDPDFNRNFSNLYNDLHWNPLPWLGLKFETQVPFIDDGSGFSEVATRLRFMPNENFEFSVGNRFLHNHPVLVDSNRIDLRGYARLTENWGFGALQLWELEDSTLEIQQYTIHRDFNHWIASLGFSARNNRFNKEYGIILSFTLKDFPSASLPLKMDGQ